MNQVNPGQPAYTTSTHNTDSDYAIAPAFMQTHAQFQRDQFLSPMLVEADEHMVMSSVKKPTRRRPVCVDRRLAYSVSDTHSSFSVRLPQKVADVRSVKVHSLEVPVLFPCFSAARGNTSFAMSFVDADAAPAVAYISLPDTICFESAAALATALDSAMSGYGIRADVSPATQRVVFTNTSTTASEFELHFSVVNGVERAPADLPQSLGWLLGFRVPAVKLLVTAQSSTTTAAAPVDCRPLRYIYLAIDECGQGASPGALTPLDSRNVLARVALDFDAAKVGSVLVAHESNGRLVAVERTFAQKFSLQSIHVHVLDERGAVLPMPFLDVSFVLDVEHD